LATIVAYQGSKRTIELLCNDDGSCPTKIFLDGLSDANRRKVDVLFEKMGETGKISNDQKFKKLEGSDGIFEYKSFQIRLLCFYAPGGRVVICRAVTKKQDRHAPNDIRNAEERRRIFLGG
jgi:hypothetical protein